MTESFNELLVKIWFLTIFVLIWRMFGSLVAQCRAGSLADLSMNPVLDTWSHDPGKGY